MQRISRCVIDSNHKLACKSVNNLIGSWFLILSMRAKSPLCGRLIEDDVMTDLFSLLAAFLTGGGVL